MLLFPYSDTFQIKTTFREAAKKVIFLLPRPLRPYWSSWSLLDIFFLISKFRIFFTSTIMHHCWRKNLLMRGSETYKEKILCPDMKFRNFSLVKMWKHHIPDPYFSKAGSAAHCSKCWPANVRSDEDESGADDGEEGLQGHVVLKALHGQTLRTTHQISNSLDGYALSVHQVGG